MIGSNDIGTTIYVTTLMILLLVAGVIIAFILSNRRNDRQEMKIVQIQMDYEKELRKVQFEVQEQVLVNIGRELHDNIGQLLTVMHLQLEQYKFVTDNRAELMQSMGGTLADTMKEVRRLGKSLNSDLFESQGLINAIQQEVLRLRQLNNYEVEWEYDLEPKLNKDQKVIVFRIFQEILNNIMKHASARKVQVSLKGADSFSMTMQDNGKGFDYEGMLVSGGGSGLKNMVKRAELARLACNITSIIGKGTIFTLETI
jgi:signal transduction histidine kinase